MRRHPHFVGARANKCCTRAHRPDAIDGKHSARAPFEAPPDPPASLLTRSRRFAFGWGHGRMRMEIWEEGVMRSHVEAWSANESRNADGDREVLTPTRKRGRGGERRKKKERKRTWSHPGPPLSAYVAWTRRVSSRHPPRPCHSPLLPHSPSPSFPPSLLRFLRDSGLYARPKTLCAEFRGSFAFVPAPPCPGRPKKWKK